MLSSNVFPLYKYVEYQNLRLWIRSTLNTKDMDKLYYITNTINEWQSKTSGFFKSLDEAMKALEECCDWYRPKGTGCIWEVEFGLNKRAKLVYEKY